jgi:hypothetical protein
MAINPKILLLLFTLLTLSINQVNSTTTAVKVLTPEEQALELKINKDFCGYLTPTTNQDCYTKTTTKSQCCVIDWQNKKACLPQSSTFFMDKRADFTIDLDKAYISCGAKGEVLGANGSISTFFGSTYCGKRNLALTALDCVPTGLETNCCYLSSTAYTTKQKNKVLRACVNESPSYNETVVAQTLFPGTDTLLTCYNAAGTVQSTTTITRKSSNLLNVSIALLITIALIFLM